MFDKMGLSDTLDESYPNKYSKKPNFHQTLR